MAEKEHIIHLSGHAYLAIWIFTLQGRLLGFVVRLMYVPDDDEGYTIARYDTAHGMPHLDVVDREGRLIQKEWLLGLSNENALAYALKDFKSHHEN